MLALLGAGATLSDVGRAQSAPPPVSALKRLTLEQLMSIEVTSVSKRPEKLSSTASAIQVVTAEDIRRAGVTRLPAALRLASNLQVAQIDSRQWAITARGFNNTTANKMLVLLDGRTLYTPLYAGVFWDAQDTLLDDLDRIEVISGPGATQWGANAVNGVINIISKSAKDTLGTLVTGGGGDELRGFGGVRIGGRAAPGVHYRIYGKYFKRDDAVFPSGGDAADQWHMSQGGFRTDWDVASDTTFTLQGDIYDGNAAQLLFDEIDLRGGNLLGRWSRTFADRSELRLQAYYDHAYRRIPGSITANIDTYDFDFQHRFFLGDAHDLVWGATYRLIEDKVAHPSTLAFLPRHTIRQWYGGFVQDGITMLDGRWHLLLGSKFEHNEYSGFEVQPSLRISWLPRENQTVWAAVSRAIRAPSRIDREFYAPAAPPFALAGGPRFTSEELIAYELGYRVRPHPNVALSLALYYHDYDDLRSLEPLAPPTPFPAMIGNGLRGRSSGAELTVDWRVTSWWRLQAGVNEMRVHSETKPGSGDLTSVRSQSLDPNHQIHVRASFDLRRDIELDVMARHVSRINNHSVPGYNEVDVRFGWQPTPSWELSLVGQNLLHRHHPEFGPVASRRDIERSIFGKAAWRF